MFPLICFSKWVSSCTAVDHCCKLYAQELLKLSAMERVAIYPKQSFVTLRRRNTDFLAPPFNNFTLFKRWITFIWLLYNDTNLQAALTRAGVIDCSVFLIFLLICFRFVAALTRNFQNTGVRFSNSRDKFFQETEDIFSPLLEYRTVTDFDYIILLFQPGFSQQRYLLELPSIRFAL